MVRLRLTRLGRKKRPFYRVVAIDKRSPRDGRHLEILGFYDPMKKPAEININLERVDYWLGVGASPSDTVGHLIKRAREGGFPVESGSQQAGSQQGSAEQGQPSAEQSA